MVLVWILNYLIFQSTLPRRERHGTAATKYEPYKISIHAPTKGATLRNCLPCLFCRISIHAPTKGATSSSKIHSTFFAISIHAPTKGATGAIYKKFADNPISIHAPTKGATIIPCFYPTICEFQSTLPRRERRKHQKTSLRTLRFQSTLPRRERQPFWFFQSLSILFQSTLPRRERRGCQLWTGQINLYFNPRSHEGSDLHQLHG